MRCDSRNIGMIHLCTIWEKRWCYDSGTIPWKSICVRAVIETAGLLGGIPKSITMTMTMTKCIQQLLVCLSVCRTTLLRMNGRQMDIRVHIARLSTLWPPSHDWLYGIVCHVEKVHGGWAATDREVLYMTTCDVTRAWCNSWERRSIIAVPVPMGAQGWCRYILVCRVLAFHPSGLSRPTLLGTVCLTDHLQNCEV